VSLAGRRARGAAGARQPTRTGKTSSKRHRQPLGFEAKLLGLRRKAAQQHDAAEYQAPGARPDPSSNTSQTASKSIAVKLLAGVGEPTLRGHAGNPDDTKAERAHVFWVPAEPLEPAARPCQTGSRWQARGRRHGGESARQPRLKGVLRRLPEWASTSSAWGN